MNKYITLNKVGKFYSAYGDDAIILHYLFDYKIVNGKVGFPIESILKIKEKLNELSISYLINGDEKIERDFAGFNKYHEYILLANSKVNIDKKMDDLITKINGLNVDEIDNLIDFINVRINKIYEAR